MEELLECVTQMSIDIDSLFTVKLTVARRDDNIL
jgi:hypothetical protein